LVGVAPGCLVQGGDALHDGFTSRPFDGEGALVSAQRGADDAGHPVGDAADIAENCPHDVWPYWDVDGSFHLREPGHRNSVREPAEMVLDNSGSVPAGRRMA